MQDYSVYEVFTPTTQARVNFIPRAGVEKTLKSALLTPGKQIVIYGESGSGKSTLLVNVLAAMEIKRITTRCNSASTFESIVLDAFDQLGPYFADATTRSTENALQATLEGQFLTIKSQLSATEKESTSTQSKRALPPQLTAQRLGQFLAIRGICWVLEDFHKVPHEHKTAVAQTLKVFSDLAAEFPDLRVIALGATDTAREVVQYDHEMRNRVAEVHVPLMSEQDLRQILINGATLLNVSFNKISSDIVAFSAGLASVTHHLALAACVHCGVTSRKAIKLVLDDGDMEAAVSQYIEESSDTLKSLFDAALVRRRERQYDNTRLLLTALATGPIEGMSHAEIRSQIQQTHSNYPAGNVTTYLRQLQRPERGSVVRATAGGKFRFKDPILHSYARAVFNVRGATHSEWSTNFDHVLSEQISATLRDLSRTALITFGNLSEPK